MGFLTLWFIIIIITGFAMYIMRNVKLSKLKQKIEKSHRYRDDEKAPVAVLAKSEWMALPGTIGGLLLAITYAICAIYIISPGHIGVPVWFGNVQETSLDDGIIWINPMANIDIMDGRRFAYEFSGDSKLLSVSKKQNPLTVEVAFPFNLNTTYAWKLRQKIGKDDRYREQFKSSARSAVRSAIAEYEWGEVTSKLEEISEKMRKYFKRNVTRDLVGLGFTTEEASATFTFLNVQLREIVPDEKILAATAEKMAALQDLERQSTLTEIAGEIAERREAEGRGVSKLFNALPDGFKPSEIQMVLEALANKTRADAMMKAVETGQVDTIIMGAAVPSIPAK